MRSSWIFSKKSFFASELFFLLNHRCLFFFRVYDYEVMLKFIGFCVDNGFNFKILSNVNNKLFSTCSSQVSRYFLDVFGYNVIVVYLNDFVSFSSVFLKEDLFLMFNIIPLAFSLDGVFNLPFMVDNMFFSVIRGYLNFDIRNLLLVFFLNMFKFQFVLSFLFK